MKRNTLGRTGGNTGIEVSALCLGTMTYGTQTEPQDAHAQIDRALDAGIDFLDTAEMYPVNPIRPETTGRSEEIIGDWIAASGRRADVVVATKHSGKGFKGARDGAPISSDTIPQAIEGSLRRLRTDVIDLYQFHWPNRGSYMFRQNWRFDPSVQDRAETLQHMQDALGALSREVERGTIRAFGLSNESAWGTAMWLKVAREIGAPEMVTIQNEYSLLCRLFDTDLAELSANDDVKLLSYSPLACGILTGKYHGGLTVPHGSRMSLNKEMGGRTTPRAWEATAAYLAIAEEHGLDPVHMALRWAADRPFMGSVIFGATSPEQLARALGAAEVTLSDEVRDAIEAAHKAHPMPY